MKHVDLSNCADEPIHIPGAIQSFGSLVAIDTQGLIRFASANAEPILGRDPRDALGRPSSGLGLFKDREDLAEWADSTELRSLEIDGRRRVAAAHRLGEFLIVEVEPEGRTPSNASYASILRSLRGARGVPATLQLVAEKTKELIGFDRVMVYRFRPDASGEVVAEVAEPELPQYLNHRFPASDIPAQARRLYVINTMRQIADVDAPPIALLQDDPGRAPLDLSQASLRSVSPIHLEYLRNIGVRASFSISILLDGKLWGLIACHNRAPAYISHAQRSLCGLFANHIAAVVDGEERRDRTLALERTTKLCAEIQRVALSQDGSIVPLPQFGPALLSLLDATGLILCLGDAIETAGEVPDDPTILSLVAALSSDETGTIVATQHALAKFPSVSLDERAAGILAVQFSPSDKGWLIWLRPEIAKRHVWGGDPNKEVVKPGPMGARLTPRGSFETYVETVRGQAQAWSRTDLEVADSLGRVITELFLRRVSETARIRQMALATLGHDLRTPLGAISMASELMRSGMPDESSTGPIVESIQRSSRRMKELLDNVSRMAELETRGSLALQTDTVDLVELVGVVVEEVRLCEHCEIVFSPTSPVEASVDGPRIQQVVANLLSNARKHGDPDRPISIRVVDEGECVLVAVHNFGPAIDADTRRTLFSPFAHGPRSRGLGLGLHIVAQVVEAHKGTVALEPPDDGGVEFVVRLPR